MNRQDGARNLLILTQVLLLSGFAGSAIYWSASGGTAFLATQEDYGGAISAAVGADARDVAVARADQQWNRVNRAARLVETHAHLLFLCILLILFAILGAGHSGAFETHGRLAWLATGGVLMYPAGLVAQALGLLLFGQVLSAAGAVLIVLFTGSIAAILLRTRPAARPPGGDRSA
jgi:hypothetical protein